MSDEINPASPNDPQPPVGQGANEGAKPAPAARPSASPVTVTRPVDPIREYRLVRPLASVRERVSLSSGATIHVRPELSNIHLFAADGGLRLN